MGRQRQEPRLLLGEDVGDGPIALLRMRALMRDLVAPALKLRVQIIDVDKRARRKEGVPPPGSAGQSATVLTS